MFAACSLIFLTAFFLYGLPRGAALYPIAVWSDPFPVLLRMGFLECAKETPKADRALPASG